MEFIDGHCEQFINADDDKPEFARVHKVSTDLARGCSTNLFQIVGILLASVVTLRRDAQQGEDQSGDLDYVA